MDEKLSDWGDWGGVELAGKVGVMGPVDLCSEQRVDASCGSVSKDLGVGCRSFVCLAIEWARASSTPLAILLLDFEKAYDRVDWGFLEGSLIRMSFPQAWIRGVSALYRSASSSVTIGGHVGRRFQLSRSVRQGCSLAPYLFLFVAEAMSDFIRLQQPALGGLLMPVSDEPDLIDQEYADDTLLFLHYTPDVLHMIRYTLEMFCVASGARINWNKSYGILAGSQDVPTWGPADFRWLRPGETCRYLGFQVGLDVSPEQQFSPVMQAMRRKLCYWSTRHLSMAGRALVANQDHETRWQTLGLAFQTLGVIYGDLGTSPLYVYPSINITDPSEQDYLGLLSIIIWTVTMVGVIKYVFIVLCADDHGEGGTFALYSLLCQHAQIGEHSGRRFSGLNSDLRLSHFSKHARMNSKTKQFLENNKVARKFLLFIVMLGTCMLIGDGILTPSISGQQSSGAAEEQ
ncbi:hypothetical protein L7F22_041712 [Adiantum nelumboides]|nr:hypothetical protein [Adiantum nelumboides]